MNIAARQRVAAILVWRGLVLYYAIMPYTNITIAILYLRVGVGERGEYAHVVVELDEAHLLRGGMRAITIV